MSTTSSSFLLNFLNVMLIASMIAMSSMYLELRYRYSELKLSCLQKGMMQAGLDESKTYSCPIACSNYCRSIAKTEQEQVYTFSELRATIKSDYYFAETVNSAKNLKSENIRPSGPKAFKTSEILLATSFAEASMQFGDSHIALFSSSLSSSDNFVSDVGFEMTFSPKYDRLKEETFCINGCSLHSKTTSLLPSEKDPGNGIYTEENLNVLKSSNQMFTIHEHETIPSTNPKSHMITLESVSQVNLMYPTTLPLFQTSSIPVFSETPTKQEFLYHQQLYTATHFAGSELDHDIMNTEDLTQLEQDPCQGDNCQDIHPGFVANLASNFEDFYEESYYEDSNNDEAHSSESQTQKQTVFSQSLSPRDFNEQFAVRAADIADLGELSFYGSSLRCEDVDQSEFCHFENLCFNTEEKDFVFLVGEESKIKYHSATADLEQLNQFVLNLSSVPDHNAHTFPLVFIPANSLSMLKVAVVKETSFIMSRFKPDNIMHVFHDDLLPLIHTLLQRRLLKHHGNSDLRLVLADLFNPRDNAYLYASIFSYTPVWLFKPNVNVDFICFKDSYTGLSKSTLWYQYGFFKPQGPLGNNVTQVLRNVKRGVNLLANIFHRPCLFCSSGNYLVLLSRKDNRLITNEGALVMGLVQSTKLKVMSVSVETHTIKDIMSILKNSRGLIGMHGSLLIFGVFLPPGSIFIELFPYGVNPSKYTPFKTFCDFPNSGIVYNSWSNLDRSKTVEHPYRSPALGGINHLPKKLQTEILEQTEVPDHLCCEDPSWLYHIYQDTEVDVGTVVAMTTTALIQASFIQDEKRLGKLIVEGKLTDKPKATNTEDDFFDVVHEEKDEYNVFVTVENQQKYFIWGQREDGNLLMRPSRVRLLSCELDTISLVSDSIRRSSHAFKVSWIEPWNLNFLGFSKVHYEIIYQIKDAASGKSVQLTYDTMEYLIQTDTLGTEYLVWVRAVLEDNLAGPDHFISCKVSDKQKNNLNTLLD